MKLKLSFISLVGLLASGSIASAQVSTPAADNSQPAATTATVAATPAVTPAATPEAAPAPTPASPQDAAQATTSVPQETATPTNSTVRDPNAIMPLISMDDTSLVETIKNLARSAGLNYMLDPKIPFLQPGPDGRVSIPTVSLRLENVTAEQALLALLNNYNLAIVDDPKTKIARITVKDPAAPDPLLTKIIQLKYADPTNMVPTIQSVLADKRSRVMADVRTSQLILVATEKEITAVDELVSRTDTQTRSVLIETRLLETTSNPKTAHGIDWTATLASQRFGFGNNVNGGQGGRYTQATSLAVQTNSLGTPFDVITTTYGPNNTLNSPRLLVDTAKGFNPTTAFLDADGVSAALSFLNTEAGAKILSTPRAVTLDNQEAVLSVTEARPIFATTAGTQGSPGGSQVTYTNLGTILHVTPRISANDMINLRVKPEVSSFNRTIEKTVSSTINQADVFDVRRIDTRVLIPSGNTLVMGGLVNDSSTTGNTKVPFFGDIPLVGRAFRSETKEQNKRDLIVFITPTIVSDGDYRPTQSSYLKTKVDEKPTAELKNWERAKPSSDWSSLKPWGNKSDSDESPK